MLKEKKPKEGETAAERKARKKRNKRRAKMRAKWIKKRRRWRYDIYGRFPDGRLRFICPFHAGKLWCDEIPPSPKVRDGAKHVDLPVGTTKCCNGTFTASLKDLVRIGHQEPPYFSTAHAKVYNTRIPVEGRFGIDQERGAYAPRSCRAPLLEPHALASLIFDAIGNLQLTMNKEIEELYEIIDNYQPPPPTASRPTTDPPTATNPPTASRPTTHLSTTALDPPTAPLDPRTNLPIATLTPSTVLAPTPPEGPGTHKPA